MKSYIFLILLCLAFESAEAAPGNSTADLSAIGTVKIKIPLLKRDLPFRVFAPKNHHATPLPAVVYLENLAVPRIGKTADDELIRSFLKDALLVIEVDYQGDPRAKGADMYMEQHSRNQKQDFF